MEELKTFFTSIELPKLSPKKIERWGSIEKSKCVWHKNKVWNNIKVNFLWTKNHQGNMDHFPDKGLPPSLPPSPSLTIYLAHVHTFVYAHTNTFSFLSLSPSISLITEQIWKMVFKFSLKISRCFFCTRTCAPATEAATDLCTIRKCLWLWFFLRPLT